jgi:(1->4)-alpha-D-glucan 1-alpha-D-glucosylmutase
VPHIPISTYRLQLHKEFTFEDASAVASYLYDLGVSHVYSSPYLQAQAGSTHGYDVVDHHHVNEELGGVEGHERFCKVLTENGLRQILDIVPNHMSIGSRNRLWWDVLENGAASRYASFFDIDWQSNEERLRDKVIMPVLADQYGRVLEAGGITVVYEPSEFFVEAAGERFPVDPTSLPMLLTTAAQYAGSNALSFLAASFARLPSPSFEDRSMVLARHRDKTVISQLLTRLCSEQSALSEAISRAVRELNADFDALHNFLNGQNYRLSYWKTSDQQLGYRRFFDVNSLIGLRMERQHVFEETHALVLDWLRRGVLDGVRVDHADGLRDPLEYFRRLRDGAPDSWIVAEKILAPGEFIRAGRRAVWPIEGTSGYDFLNATLRMLVRTAGMSELSKIYAEFTGQSASFSDIGHEKKVTVGQEGLGSDVNRLTSLFVNICETHRNQRDYTRAEIRRAIREIAASFSVYRTYVIPQRSEIAAEDRKIIARAIHGAKSARPDIDAGLFDFLERVLTLQVTGTLETEFVLRFQQFTPAIMAKGVEDTAFYCFNRLVALCEVGGDPSSNGSSLEEFHAYQQKMQNSSPTTMTVLSTHDTKRSDDVRARLAVLSEMPHQFADVIVAWAKHNEQYKTSVGGQMLPDRNSEYFLYQTLIGAWPLEVERAKSYMQKAMREAKQQTSWMANNRAYEDALNHFIESILDDREFTASLEDFVNRVITPGRINSLTQTLLKNIGPGVPDHYQGSELWDLSLVDPDNRRPVDYELRARLLHEMKTLSAQEILERMNEGMPKLHVVHQSLRLRREHPEWFGAGSDYTALHAAGAKATHVVAFLRGSKVAAVCPRHVHTLGGDWADTSIHLPCGVWHNCLTGGSIEQLSEDPITIRTLLGEFPVALLILEDSKYA